MNYELNYLGQDTEPVETLDPVSPRELENISVYEIRKKMGMMEKKGQVINVKYNHYDFVMAYDKAQKEGLLPDTPLEYAYATADIYFHDKIRDKQWRDYFWHLFKIDGPGKKRYYATLEREPDARKYIQLLGLHKSVLSLKNEKDQSHLKESLYNKKPTYQDTWPKDTHYDVLNIKYVNPMNKQSVSHVQREFDNFYFVPETIPLKNTVLDILHYEKYVKKFGEIARNLFMQEAFKTLDMAKIRDLPALSDYYNVVLNRVTTYLQPYITKTYKIRVRYPSGAVCTYESKIPPRYQKQLLNDIDIGLDYMRMNLPKVESQIAKTSDPGAQFQPSAWSTDPLSNPFLVYDKQKSDETGALTFKNLARNVAMPEPKYVTVSEFTDIAEKKYYDMAPKVRALYTRNIPVEGGGRVSINDLVVDGALEPGKINTALLWTGGGVLAAVVLSQML